MKVRNTSNPEDQKIEPPMAPMIDVVFQLLIFFMLTLKIVEPEGDFSINMPAVNVSDKPMEKQVAELKVRLIANEDGSLQRVFFGDSDLGTGEAAFKRLNSQILGIIGQRDNVHARENTEVEIDADYGLHFQYTIDAVGACSGTVDTNTGKIIPLLEKIKFAQPRRPVGK